MPRSYRSEKIGGYRCLSAYYDYSARSNNIKSLAESFNSVFVRVPAVGIRPCVLNIDNGIDGGYRYRKGKGC